MPVHVTRYLKTSVEELNEKYHCNITPESVEELSKKIQILIQNFMQDIYEDDKEFMNYLDEIDDQGYLGCELEEELLHIIHGNLF